MDGPSVLSTQPSAVLLSQRLLRKLPEALGLQITDLGYLPSSAFGGYAVGGFQARESTWEGLPELQTMAIPAKPDGIFILADSEEGARFWVEQFSVRQPSIPIFLLVTAQAGPMLTYPKKEYPKRKMLVGC